MYKLVFLDGRWYPALVYTQRRGVYDSEMVVFLTGEGPIITSLAELKAQGGEIQSASGTQS